MRAGVLGSPIAHSLSPVLHNAGYQAAGLTGWEYDAHEVDAAGLAGFVDRLGPQWRGLSLTMPLKPVAAEVVRIGGSGAQREMIEDMLLLALIRAGEAAKARALLDRRLHRRPSPRDRRWHGLLAA